MIIYVIIAVWLVGIFVAYNIMKSWNNTKAEKVWFSIIWPLLIPLFIIHWVNKTF